MHAYYDDDDFQSSPQCLYLGFQTSNMMVNYGNALMNGYNNSAFFMNMGGRVACMP